MTALANALACMAVAAGVVFIVVLFAGMFLPLGYSIDAMLHGAVSK
jgi:hypothetical protein